MLDLTHSRMNPEKLRSHFLKKLNYAIQMHLSAKTIHTATYKLMLPHLLPVKASTAITRNLTSIFKIKVSEF